MDLLEDQSQSSLGKPDEDARQCVGIYVLVVLYLYNFVRGCTKYKRRAQVDTNEGRRSALAAAMRKSSGIFL